MRIGHYEMASRRGMLEETVYESILSPDVDCRGLRPCGHCPPGTYA